MAYSPRCTLRNLLRMLVSKSWSVCGSRNIATGFTRTGFSPQHWWRQKLRPEMNRLHPVHSLMLLFTLFFLLRHEGLNFHIGSLFSALHDIGVKPIYPIPPSLLCQCWLPVSIGRRILTIHLIRARWRHHCCIDVRSDDKYLKEVSPENLLK